MRTFARVVSAASIFVALGAGPALAQPHHDDHHWDGDIHHFGDHDFGRWRGGTWFHGIHEGRSGWWWVVGPDFYFYSAPVYPYPDPYVPPVVSAAPAPAQSVWYYCSNPQGYYPYVPQCAVPWQQVPAQ
ncbi:MAG TPA: hypothetical protein VLV50_13640 [Stellaceae bacterium]|nr:hypothetical protein [Stellaceae bacterium]